MNLGIEKDLALLSRNIYISYVEIIKKPQGSKTNVLRKGSYTWEKQRNAHAVISW